MSANGGWEKFSELFSLRGSINSGGEREGEN